jgi:hypothetical protein
MRVPERWRLAASAPEYEVDRTAGSHSLDAAVQLER